ncbi:citrate lyase subunit beta [Candidatus Poribacteria bacterium]|nr:MAG: citrate lyase subunit beta [Candidatus Poribacteria bacterium]
MQVMRSWMFVPGHQQRMIDKAYGLKLDVAMFDIEDGVPPGEKNTARAMMPETLDRPSGGMLRFVRIHPAGTKEIEVDLPAVIRPGLDGLTLTKVNSPEDVLAVGAILDEREEGAGLQRGSVRLLATIESAKGLVQAAAIAASSPRLVGLMFGAEDFAMDMGMFNVRQEEAGDYLYARSALAIAAASAGLQVIDRVYVDIRNLVGLEQDTRIARDLGFTGKALIHPAQIDVVEKVFRPTDAEVEYARRVVDAFEAAEAEGAGAVAVDGQMVDLPVVERARRALQLVSENPSHK